MDYVLGFSWKGLVVFLLAMLPNVLYFLQPPSSGQGSKKKHLVLDIVEHGSQALFILLLVFLVSGRNAPVLSPHTIGMAILLLLYYALWIFYFAGRKSLIALYGMAVIPVAYFILAEFWLHISVAAIPTVIFGFVHIMITSMDNPSHPG